MSGKPNSNHPPPVTEIQETISFHDELDLIDAEAEKFTFKKDLYYELHTVQKSEHKHVHEIWPSKEGANQGQPQPMIFTAEGLSAPNQADSLLPALPRNLLSGRAHGSRDSGGLASNDSLITVGVCKYSL